MSKVASLIAEVIATGKRGCKVQYIEHPEAIQFIQGVTKAKQSGSQPNIAKAEEILKEEWKIDLPRRSLSEHVRGKCGCRKRI